MSAFTHDYKFNEKKAWHELSQLAGRSHGIPTAFTWIWKVQQIGYVCAVSGLQKSINLKKHCNFLIQKYTTPDVLYYLALFNITLNSQHLQSFRSPEDRKVKRPKIIVWLNFYQSIFVKDIKYDCMTVLTGANSSYKMRLSLDSWKKYILVTDTTHTENKALKPDPYYIHLYINSLLCTRV